MKMEIYLDEKQKKDFMALDEDTKIGCLFSCCYTTSTGVKVHYDGIIKEYRVNEEYVILVVDAREVFK